MTPIQGDVHHRALVALRKGDPLPRLRFRADPEGRLGFRQGGRYSQTGGASATVLECESVRCAALQARRTTSQPRGDTPGTGSTGTAVMDVMPKC